MGRSLPVISWLPAYNRELLRPDIIAGLTVWALMVPESLAYAGIAGVPVQFALYSIPLCLLAYVVFGTSRELFVGPSATVATLSASAVAAVGAAGAQSGESWIALSAALALLVGAIYIVLGLLRAGFIARFFAKPVLAGFVVGLGIYIAAGQLPKLVGIEKPDGDTIMILLRTLGEIGSWDPETLAMGGAALALLVVLAKAAPRAPGALIAVALGIAAVALLGLDEDGVAIVGAVPTGYDFVSWSAVGWDQIKELLPGAVSIVVVGYAQSVAIAKEYAGQKGYRIDPSQELVAYGAANVGAGALQGFTVTGSLAKSAAGQQAGGRSPVLLLVAAALTVLTTLVLAGLFEQLPEAVLAAIVIHAVSGMIDFGKLARLWRAHLAEFWLALGAMAGVVVFGILAGVVIGVALSFVLLIHRLDHPGVRELGRSREDERWVSLDSDPQAAPADAVLVLRFEAPIVFANAEIFLDEMFDRAVAAGAQGLVVDMEAVPDIDTTGDDAIVQLAERLRARGVAFALARVHHGVLDFMRRDGAIDKIGPESVHGAVRSAVEALAPAAPHAEAPVPAEPR